MGQKGKVTNVKKCISRISPRVNYTAGVNRTYLWPGFAKRLEARRVRVCVAVPKQGQLGAPVPPALRKVGTIFQIGRTRADRRTSGDLGKSASVA